ncbi:uncharacterized protein LOC135086621 isoform X2 [Ostrinia nubilalis]|uniref:uncharacterized protein LOC135086621 isoform X2 n=1 Tax=Ostrinia nubilalis TaxID=29057 RepID=UPI00308252EE
MERKAVILIILPILEGGDLPWHKWSWSAPQAPIEYFFRRQGSMPIKSPRDNFECTCPPHRECEVEFKMNEDMVEFLKLRGLLKKEDIVSYQKDIEDYRKSNGLSPKEYIRENRFRRSNIDDDDDDCCCPPRSVMMPTFITEKRFDEMVEQFDKKQVPPSVMIK